MKPRTVLIFAGIVFLATVLLLLFPALLEFIEKFTGDLRFFWWVILLVALAVWLIFWGFGRDKK